MEQADILRLAKKLNDLVSGSSKLNSVTGYADNITFSYNGSSYNCATPKRPPRTRTIVNR